LSDLEQDYRAAGARDRFDPGHGRPMREWVSLAPATDLAASQTLMAEALIFVAAAVATGRRG